MCEDHVMYDPFFSRWVSKITLILPEVKMVNVNTSDRGVYYRVEVVKVNKGKHPANADNYNLTMKDLGVSGNLQCSESSIAEVIITNDKITWNCSTDSSDYTTPWWSLGVFALLLVMILSIITALANRRKKDPRSQYSHPEHRESGLYLEPLPGPRQSDMYLEPLPGPRQSDMYLEPLPRSRQSDMYLESLPQSRQSDMYLEPLPRPRQSVLEHVYDDIDEEI
nr:uncharacterized protein LOC123748574 [Procambarus clarkii]